MLPGPHRAVAGPQPEVYSPHPADPIAPEAARMASGQFAPGRRLDQPGREGQCLVKVLRLQIGVRSKDLLSRAPTRKQPKHRRDRHAESADERPPSHDVRVHGHARESLHGSILRAVP